MTETNNIFEVITFLEDLDISELDTMGQWVVAGVRARLRKAFAESNLEQLTKDYRYYSGELRRLEDETPDDHEGIERCRRKIRALIRTVLENDVTGSYRETRG